MMVRDGNVSNKSIKTLFTSDKGKTCILGELMWNDKDRIEYYEEALTNWKSCYKKKSPDYKYIVDYCNMWIDESSKDLMVN